MNTIKIGGMTLICPPTAGNYRVENVIVSGREVTALSGAPLSLGIIRKKKWTLTFHPDTQYDAIIALLETQTTFQDYDGTIYSVVVTGNPSVSKYPISTMGQMSLTLREV